MVFKAVTIATFSDVELFRASDTKGGGWNQYGMGNVRVNFIQDCDVNVSDCQGKGQLTFHNKLTSAAGINMLVVENLPVYLDIVDDPKRLTFKALSQTIGNNGLVNMYSMRFRSSEDAARLWCQLSVLQFAAKQANEGHPITIPNSTALEATMVRAFLSTNQVEADRFLILTRLVQLAAANPDEFSSHSHQWAEVFFGAPFGLNNPSNVAQYSDEEHYTCTTMKKELLISEPVREKHGDDDSDEASYTATIVEKEMPVESVRFSHSNDDSEDSQGGEWLQENCEKRTSS